MIAPAHPPVPFAPDPVPSQAPWDLFCRVIDNHGDLGVCWRLARQLAGRGVAVRLWVDDAAALAWMAPGGAAATEGVQVLPWREPLPAEQPGPVVIEAFGCNPPPGFVALMAARMAAPVWINLEYLSAEAYVERSHALASPQWHGPGAGLTTWFFYPGFTPATGGLLREPGLPQDPLPPGGPRRAAWAAQGLAEPAPGERVLLLFAYEPPALAPLLRALMAPPPAQPAGPPASSPSRRLLVTPGRSTAQVQGWLDARAVHGSPPAAWTHWLGGALTLTTLPPRAQPDFDRLLALTDLNLVRGEDSLVAALRAGRPLLWQLYPQDDGAHAVKLEAFLARYLDRAPTTLAGPLRQAFRGWNDLQPWDAEAWAALDGPLWPQWQAWALERARTWMAEPPLLERLCAFIESRGGPKVN